MDTVSIEQGAARTKGWGSFPKINSKWELHEAAWIRRFQRRLLVDMARATYLVFS